MGCGPQIAVEEDMVVKLGPLVAVVVVEAAACCLLPACPRVQGMRAQIAAYAWGGGPYVVAQLALWSCNRSRNISISSLYKTATSALPIVGLRHNEGKLWATASSASSAGWSSPGAPSLAKVVVTA